MKVTGCPPVAGYRVSSTHATPLAVKTDAPPEVIWDVMRAWVKKQGNEKVYPEGAFVLEFQLLFP
jgi:hypothetical protein